jgi:hypothetical protein
VEDSTGKTHSHAALHSSHFEEHLKLNYLSVKALKPSNKINNPYCLIFTDQNIPRPPTPPPEIAYL